MKRNVFILNLLYLLLVPMFFADGSVRETDDRAVLHLAGRGPATQDRWLGGNGSWNDGNCWSLGRPPRPADDVVIYSGGSDYVMLLGGTESVESLTIGGSLNGYASELVDGGGVTYFSTDYLMVGASGVLEFYTQGSSLTLRGSSTNYGRITANMQVILSNFSYLTNHATVENYGTLDNYERIDNLDKLKNVTLLENHGRIENGSGAYIYNQNATFTNSADSLGVSNYGYFINQGGTLNNGGDFVNYATFDNHYAGMLNNSGTFTNFGNFDKGMVNNSGTINNHVTFDAGIVENHGSIYNSGTWKNITSGLVNYGYLENQQQFINTATLTNYGNLNNSGMLSNSGDYATFENDAAFSNSGSFLNAAPLFNLAGTISNSGVFNNTSSGSVTNAAGATVENSGSISNYGNFKNEGLFHNTARFPLDNYGNFTNTGSFHNEGIINNYGTFTSSGPLTNDAGWITVLQGGTLSVSGGYTQLAGATAVNGLFVSSTKVIQIDGGPLTGSGTIQGNVVIGSNGWMSPGDGVGTLTIQGNYTQVEGSALEVQLGGVEPGEEYDQLFISGLALINGGALRVLLQDGFYVQAGEGFVMMTFAPDMLDRPAPYPGYFSTLDLPVLQDGLGWQLMYDPTDITLWVVQYSDSQATPEPATLVFFGAGILAVAARLHRLGHT